MDVPPPMPTVQDAIKAVDQSMERATIPAVRAKLKEMRGFDASPSEVAKALEEWKIEVRLHAMRLIAVALSEVMDAYGGPSWMMLREMEKELLRVMERRNKAAWNALEEFKAAIRRNEDTAEGRKEADEVAQILLDAGYSPEQIVELHREDGLKPSEIALKKLRGSKDADNAGTG